MTSKNQLDENSFNSRLRQFNKQYFNRFSLGLAGRPGSPWSAIQHKGRFSDRPYVTPIAARQQDGHYVIPLPYGTDVDWCQNVLAAGEATLITGGHAYHVDEPDIIPNEEAMSAFPQWMQGASSRPDATQFLRVRRLDEDQEAYLRLGELHPAWRSLAILAGVLAVIVFLVSLPGRKSDEAAEETTSECHCC